MKMIIIAQHHYTDMENKEEFYISEVSGSCPRRHCIRLPENENAWPAGEIPSLDRSRAGDYL